MDNHQGRMGGMNQFASYPNSLPTSRAPSPPIHLAPLLLKTSNREDKGEQAGRRALASSSEQESSRSGKKVVLPHFSEIEAAVAADQPGYLFSRGARVSSNSSGPA